MSVINTKEYKDYQFGPWPVHASEVFATTALSYAFVNLKPVVPGHVLVSPKRVVPRFSQLSLEEVADLWALAQRVCAAVELHFGASSATLAIQDGPAAGQTVAHVHVHVLPRREGDFKRNDEVYDAIDDASKEVPAAAAARKKENDADGSNNLDLDQQRKPRTAEEMAAEGKELRALFE